MGGQLVARCVVEHLHTDGIAVDLLDLRAADLAGRHAYCDVKLPSSDHAGPHSVIEWLVDHPGQTWQERRRPRCKT